MIRVAFPANTSSNAAVNLLSRSRIQEPETAGACAEIHEQVPGLLGSPGSGRVRGDAQDIHGPGLDLHREQDVHAAEEDRVDMQKIARQDADACAARNCRQVGDARRGAGRSPAAARIRRIVPSPIRYPRPTSSPWMRR